MSQPSPASSFGFTSAAHRVQANPELLGIIFSFGTRASNVSYALVCRGWRESALDNVWREVDDIHYLLQLLAPLRTRNSTLVVNFYVPYSRRTQPSKTNVPFQEFTRVLTLEDWTRFIPLLAVCILSSVGANSMRNRTSWVSTASFMTWLAYALPLRFSQIFDPFGGI